MVENAAKTGDFAIMVPAVEFVINCTCSDKMVNVSRFNSYVERTVAIPDGIDRTKITTGIIVSPDGTVRHVPTQIIQINGKYYAKINSLTNSIYTVVSYTIEFSDIVNHWAKDAINNMGSRMIVTGMGNGNYNPDGDITRGEFAAIVVRALGLETGRGEYKFSDVKATNWFSGYIETASKYGIINGYNESTFAPNDKITREQAMTMIARAMKITGLESSLKDNENYTVLKGYSDAEDIADYAKSSIVSCLKTGVVSGTSSNTLAPKGNITRAEVALIIERLLEKSKLI
ncbi:S-layer homology domain-containing protein [Vallitalea maricola]|uniref:S-layer homology domain-containing protein n=2 Tax=Vallitalea maricola TaxID=3074433 RepID=UPI0030D7A175